MDSLGAGQEGTDGKRRNSGGDVLHRKRSNDAAHNSSEEVRLARRSTDATPTTYPAMFYPMLLETSSSTKFPLSTGIGEPLLNSHSNMVNFTTMDVLGLGLPLPPRLHGAAFTPRFGIPNFNQSAALGEQLSELLPYSCGEAAAVIRRSTLFPYAGTCFPVINALKTNGISPFLLCEQQGMPTPGVTHQVFVLCQEHIWNRLHPSRRTFSEFPPWTTMALTTSADMNFFRWSFTGHSRNWNSLREEPTLPRSCHMVVRSI